MDSVIIRPAYGPDIPYLYRICLQTGWKGRDATLFYSDPFLLGQYYATPYFFFDSRYCFVLESPSFHTPAGYIVGTADTAGFSEWMKKEWIPHLVSSCRSGDKEAMQDADRNLRTLILSQLKAITDDNSIEYIRQKQVETEYPAHFHINILPELQRQGWGRKLVETFTDTLAEMHIAGVHLGVDRDNTNAYAFYKRENFSVIHDEPWGFLLGKKL